MPQSAPSRVWWFILTLAAAALLEYTSLDRRLQEQFYDAVSGRWWVDENEQVGRVLFYDGPKVLMGILGVAVIALAAGPARWRTALAQRGWRTDRKRLVIVLVAAGFVPAFVGFLKNVSCVFCPSELMLFGGTAPYLRPFASMMGGYDGPSGHCWPAGHPSGAFALLMLTSLASTARQRTALAGLALGLGWTMGIYQMLKGAHFLSHILVTMAIAMVVAWIVGRILGEKSGNGFL